MIEERTLRYILEFLCRNDSIEICSFVAYCERNHIPEDKKIIILQSSFFDVGIYGTKLSDPVLPLEQWEGVPILFGQPYVEHKDEQWIIHADLVASTYYLITRYEEYIKPDVRDKHGRFPGKASLPCRAGFIDRPVVDEYSKLLRDCLRKAGVPIGEPKLGFSKIYLTHDLDCPWRRFSVFTAAKECLRSLIKDFRVTIFPFLNILGNVNYDPLNMFDRIIAMDQQVKEAVPIYFLKTGNAPTANDSAFDINSNSYQKLLNMLVDSGAEFGLHPSYYAGQHTESILDEKKIVEKSLGKKIFWSRNHYLRSMEPCDFEALIEAGITDDFTMGYADIAGFRLGTCHPVKWINPERGILSELTLHHLTIMEGTLFSKEYMSMDLSEAESYSLHLLNQVKANAGELVLLWHNKNINRLDWKLYQILLQFLSE